MRTPTTALLLAVPLLGLCLNVGTADVPKRKPSEPGMTLRERTDAWLLVRKRQTAKRADRLLGTTTYLKALERRESARPKRDIRDETRLPAAIRLALDRPDRLRRRALDKDRARGQAARFGRCPAGADSWRRGAQESEVIDGADPPR